MTMPMSAPRRVRAAVRITSLLVMAGTPVLVLVSVQRGSAPTDKLRGVGGGQAAGSGLLDNAQLLVRVRVDRRSAELGAGLSSGRHARRDPLAAEGPFVVGEAGEPTQHWAAVGAARVDAVLYGAEADATVAEHGHGVQGVDERPAEAVIPPHDDGVAFLAYSRRRLRPGPSDGFLASEARAA